jgi:O-antigen/teichoic acid export membrane protein
MIEKIKKSSFLKNTLLLVSGTTIAQAIPMVISPILTRIYEPKSFGVLMIYVSYISILGVIATTRYEKAIIIPASDHKAKSLVGLSQLFIILFCILLGIINLFFGNWILTQLNAQELIPYSWMLVLGVLFLASDQTYYHWANRVSAYKAMSISKISNNLSSGISSLLFGFLQWEAIGLMASKVIGIMASTITNLRTFTLKSLQELTVGDLKSVAKEYISFPKYIMPGHLLNAIALNGPPIAFALFYTETEVGYFALTQRVIMLPVSIIARSVGDVFRQKATDQYNKLGNFRSLYLKTLGGLFAASILPFIVLLLFSPFLFTFIFGAEWENSGLYAQILAILFLLQFITSPLTNVFIITGKQKLEFVWQILFLLSSILPIIVGYYIFNNMYDTLILFAVSRAAIYLLSLFLTLPLSIKKVKQ